MNLNISFNKYYKLFNIISIILVILSILSILFKGLNGSALTALGIELGISSPPWFLISSLIVFKSFFVESSPLPETTMCIEKAPSSRKSLPATTSFVPSTKPESQFFWFLNTAPKVLISSTIFEDLRFELKLDAGVARKVFSIKESYLRGESDARWI